MKLAEALIERKALQEKITRLRERLVENAKVQEGDAPQEDPRALLTEVDAALRDLQTLTTRINATNIRTPLATGETRNVMDAIAERDMLMLKRTILAQLVQATSITQPRGFGVTRNEVKFRPTVDVAALHQEIDALAKQYRELDTQIQACNFVTDVVE
ncbi:MAG: DIP1984 family protein [Chloroflexi bacterium]|nr:DIP1984 family protein [Chloroflexota bacterium]